MAQEGIATLPQAPENQASSGEPMSFSQDLSSIKSALANQDPESIAQYDQGMEATIQSIDAPIEELQALLQSIEYILKNEKEYPQIRQQLISSGAADEEDLPEQFDRGYFTTMLVVAQEAINRKQSGSGISAMGGMDQMGGMPMMPQPPQGFAAGGLAGAAESLRQKGRNGDTVLAHINPQEAMMLRAMGGSGTINPATGLPEFFFKKAFKAVGNAVKSVVSSPIGRIIATVALTAALGPAGLGMSTMFAAGLAGTAVSLAGGSDLKTALISGVTSGAMAGLAPGISDMLPGAGGYLNAAATGAIMGAGYGAATGQNLKQIGMSALTGGAIAGAASYAQGAGATGRGAEGQGGVFSRETPAPVSDSSQGIPVPAEVNAGQITQAGGSIASPNAVTGADPTGGASGFGIKFSGAPSSEFAMQPPGGSSGIGGLNPSVPGAPAVSTPGTYQPASFMDRAGAFVKSPSLSNFGDMMVAPDPTSQQLMNSDVFRQATAQGASFNSAMSAAKDALTPGMIAKYGPAVGLGIGALSLSGGFDSKPATPPGLVERDAQGNPVTGETLINQDPSRYVVQNLQGVRYDPSGRINYGQGTNTSAYGMMGQNTVPTPAFSFNPPNYMTPGNTASQTPGMGIQQPYNTAATYDFMNSSPYYRPQRFYNMGGDVMGYQDGGSFPRRTGQIDGPGTGTSDSIPAMLSDGEFVMTAKAVKGVGNGSRRSGAKKLYRMMHAMEKKAGGKV